MIYFPAVFFSVILLYILLKRGFDVSAYVTTLYVFASIMSIIVAKQGLMEPIKLNTSFFSSIVYCVLIGLIILPLYKLNSKTLRPIIIPNEKVLDYLTYIYAFCFVFTLIIYWKDIIYLFTLGDWGYYRNLVVRGETLTGMSRVGFLKYFSIIVSFIGSISFIMFPVFFINICFRKKPIKHNILSFCGTLNVVLSGILYADRSSSFRWLLFLGLNLVLFWHYLNGKQKKMVVPIASIAIGFIIFYVITVTTSRFGDFEQGGQESVVRYGGISYINFCYFFDNFDNNSGFIGKYFFPAFHHFILNDYDGNIQFQEELSMQTGFECATFYSVLGSFVMDANRSGPFLFVILYSLLFYLAMKQGRNKTFSFNSFMLVYILSLIPTFGIIAYCYTSYTHTIDFILLFIFLALFNRNKRKKSC